jgi:hypothetical protein
MVVGGLAHHPRVPVAEELVVADTQDVEGLGDLPLPVLGEVGLDGLGIVVVVDLALGAVGRRSRSPSSSSVAASSSTRSSLVAA